MYLMFNQNEGVSADNPTVGNRVAITAQEKDNGKIMQIAILDTHQEYRAPNWEGKGDDLVVKVCSIDTSAHPSCKARVLVFIDNAEKRLSCDGTGTDETCSEKFWNKWVLRIRNGRTIMKSCKWLGKLKERKPGKAMWYCNILGITDTLQTSQICCNTCQTEVSMHLNADKLFINFLFFNFLTTVRSTRMLIKNAFSLYECLKIGFQY
jgi:hypothetical protein